MARAAYTQAPVVAANICLLIADECNESDESSKSNKSRLVTYQSRPVFEGALKLTLGRGNYALDFSNLSKGWELVVGGRGRGCRDDLDVGRVWGWFGGDVGRVGEED